MMGLCAGVFFSQCGFHLALCFRLLLQLAYCWALRRPGPVSALFSFMALFFSPSFCCWKPVLVLGTKPFSTGCGFPGCVLIN